MSQFLPETMQPTQVTPAVNFTPPVGDASGDVALMQRVLSAAVQNPSMIPSDFMAYVVDFIQTQRLIIPIGQVFGFQNFLSTQVAVATAVPIDTNGSTVNTSFSDLSDEVGPTLTGLVPGQYVFLFGALAGNTVDGTGIVMSLDYGSGATDSDGAQTQVGGKLTAISRAVSHTLSAATTTVTARYRVGANTGNFQYRWLIAIRYAN